MRTTSRAFHRPTSKRTYPKGTLASQVIGFANENGGAMGLEAAYNDELTGENGMVVTARDRDGRSVLYQYDQYFDAENGCDLHTTLDTTIQYYLEKGVQELEARFGTGKAPRHRHGCQHRRGAGDGVAATYDLNSPGTVYNDFLTSGMTEEQVLENMRDLLNKQWRSKAINDTYEPGSTFKTLTLAMALEENVVDLNTGFYCSGSVKIEGETINCSKRAPVTASKPDAGVRQLLQPRVHQHRPSHRQRHVLPVHAGLWPDGEDRRRHHGRGQRLRQQRN